MGLIRFVTICIIFCIIAFILVLTLDIIFTVMGLPLNSFAEKFLQLLIIYYGVSKFGYKKVKNKYSNFPK